MRSAKVAATTLLGLLLTGASAQQAPQPQRTTGPITLDVVVTPGENGKPVPGLPQGNFTVLDNGAQQPINSFRAVAGQNTPVKVLIVIDAVNVDFQRLAYERQQLDRFLSANDGRLSQSTALAIFTDTGTQIQPAYTTDGNTIRQELDKQGIGLRDIRRSAGFWGADERLQLSLKTLDQMVTRVTAEPGRKFILWMTPGWPLLSGPGIQLSSKQEQGIFNEVVGFSDALRRSNTTLYVVDPLGASQSPGRTFYFEEFVKGIKKPSQAVLGDLGVQVLAIQSGGQFLSGNNDLTALLQRCFADASAYYEIQYQPPPGESADEYHRTEVRVAEPRMVARTRQGYYSQPVSASR